MKVGLWQTFLLIENFNNDSATNYSMKAFEHLLFMSHKHMSHSLYSAIALLEILRMGLSVTVTSITQSNI